MHLPRDRKTSRKRHQRRTNHLQLQPGRHMAKLLKQVTGVPLEISPRLRMLQVNRVLLLLRLPVFKGAQHRE